MRPSWVPLEPQTPFPLENLPLGAFARAGDREPHLGIAIGDRIFDLTVAASAGLFDEALPQARSLLAGPVWNGLFAGGRAAVRRVRERTAALLAPSGRDAVTDAAGDAALVRAADVAMRLPIAPGDYVDFYASIAHATRVGRLFRPGEPPLPAAYRHLPIGYHGRASSIVVSGTAVTRPPGQILRDGTIAFAPSAMLDYELELAYLTSAGPALGTPVAVAAAREAIVGVALLNDWSARDVQSFEYRPLGPMLGKSFATSLGAWIVTLDALDPYRVAGARQEPPPLPHLRDVEPRADDVRCEVALSTARSRAAGLADTIVARPRASALYWSAAQMLAHLTSNGARVRAGDLFATGTISSGPPDDEPADDTSEPADDTSEPSDDAFEPGSLLERTHGGAEPLVIDLPGGSRERRRFLEDGDEVVMRAWCEATGALPRIGFGEVRGRIEPARDA